MALCNPFEGAQAEAALDQLHATVDAAHGEALPSNPFARAISGLALSGIEHLQNKVVGAMDGLADQVGSITVGQPQAAGARAATLPASPPPGVAGAASSPEPAADPANPFAKPPVVAHQEDEQEPASSGGTSPVAALEDDGATGTRPDDPGNPFAPTAAPAGSTYYDPSSRSTLSIPVGSALFRDAKGAPLRVIPIPPADKTWRRSPLQR